MMKIHGMKASSGTEPVAGRRRSQDCGTSACCHTEYSW